MAEAARMEEDGRVILDVSKLKTIKAELEVNLGELLAMEQWIWYKRANGGTMTDADKTIIAKIEYAHNEMYRQAKEGL